MVGAREGLCDRNRDPREASALFFTFTFLLLSSRLRLHPPSSSPLLPPSTLISVPLTCAQFIRHGSLACLFLNARAWRSTSTGRR